MSILERLYTHTNDQAVKDILRTYEEQWSCVVSFLYFANVMHWRLLEKQSSDMQKDYLHALTQADYILPDGIALQLFSKYGKSKQTVHNLNGTDFTPYLLKQLDPQKTTLILYGGFPHVAQKIYTYYTQQWFNVLYWQDGYIPFDRSQLEERTNLNDMTYLLLVATWTPRQEIRASQNIHNIRKHKLLVLLVGGLFDFLAWEERRAPARMIRARVLETPWRILTNPTKNLRKLLRMFGIIRYRVKSISSWK